MSRLLAHQQSADDRYLTQVVDEVLLPVGAPSSSTEL
jgi:hypothetical protein